jgi:hypothetical protein
MDTLYQGINGVVVTWVVAIMCGLDPPGVRFPLNALNFASSIDITRVPNNLSSLCFIAVYFACDSLDL